MQEEFVGFCDAGDTSGRRRREDREAYSLRMKDAAINM